MDYLILIAVVVLVLWIATMGFYWYVAQQDNAVAKQIESLSARLQDDQEAL